MNDSKFAQRLVGELPGLVSRGVIDAGGAEALRRHYEGQVRPSRAGAVGLTISAILGGLLVGAGIILLIAHNWDDLSRPMRAVFAMLPLVISVVLSGYVVLRKMGSAAWREGCGVFYFLSVGASIALVSQTYHLYNDLEGFLFVWAVLSLPLMYLLNSGAVFVGCLACVVAYTVETNGFGRWRYGWQIAYLRTTVWLLVAALPFYVWHVWKRRESLMVVWLSWALAATILIIIATIFKSDVSSGSVVVGYGLTFVVYYLASCCWFGEMRGWRAPFRSIGTLGIVVMAIVLTFSDVYRDLWWNANGVIGDDAGAFLAVVYLAWLLLVLFAVWRRKYYNWAAACFPVVLALLLPMLLVNVNTLPEFWPVLAMRMPLIMSAYVFLLGVFTLASGIKRDSLLSMNEGAVLIAALVVCRFFNDDYSFVARGVAFIVIGCVFLVMNWLVVRRRQKQKEQKGGVA